MSNDPACDYFFYTGFSKTSGKSAQTKHGYLGPRYNNPGLQALKKESDYIGAKFYY